jgi:hypothetical protein
MEELNFDTKSLLTGRGEIFKRGAKPLFPLLKGETRATVAKTKKLLPFVKGLP